MYWLFDNWTRQDTIILLDGAILVVAVVLLLNFISRAFKGEE